MIEKEKDRHVVCGLKRATVVITMFGVTCSHLLNGTLSLEEDAAPQQLGEDAAHGPDVNGRPIVPAAHQHFWRSVVLSHHLLGHVP